ncbi:MAG: hypothetical protein HC831_25460 [Chloroflexia bacterium]|nr:hypothetical protein [Chloroflexia bacterium]
MDIDLEYISYGKRKILVRTFKGEVIFEDVIASWQHCLKQKLLTEDVVGAVSNFSEAKINAVPEEVY